MRELYTKYKFNNVPKGYAFQRDLEIMIKRHERSVKIAPLAVCFFVFLPRERTT